MANPKSIPARDVSTWLRGTIGEHTELLDRMRSALTKNLPAEAPGVLPDRDWCRVYGLYQAGYNALLQEERERAKLALLAQRNGSGPAALTDDEYQLEMRALARDALKELSPEELAAELERRGVRLPEPRED